MHSAFFWPGGGSIEECPKWNEFCLRENVWPDGGSGWTGEI